MPGKSRRVLGARVYHNYSDQQLSRALECINDGRSYRDVSREFGIPISSLSRKKRGLFNRKYGGQTVLTADEEKQIVEGIKTAGIWGFPLSVYDVKIIVKNYLEKKGQREKRFKHNMPGRRWMERFLKDHSNVLSERNAENIKRSRAEVSQQVIKDYFSELEKSLEGVQPSHIFNYDETNFTDDPGKKRVIVKRGAKHPERCIDSSKSSVSVMMAGTSDGVILPPYVVYKSEYLYDTWTNYGPRGARYNRSKSGWFDMRIFEDWFQSIVVPFVRNLEEGPKVMIGDNLSSHVSLAVIEQCKKYDIRFILLPPNSTHLCQPLDVSFFHPLKVSWRKQIGTWKMKNRGCVPKDQFPSLLRLTLEGLPNAKQNLISGFKACGINPFDPTQVLKRLPSWLQEGTTEDEAKHLNCSFIELLKSIRHPDGKTERQQKKKRLDVVPGKSITGKGSPGSSHDIDNTIEEVISKYTTFSRENDIENPAHDLDIGVQSTSKMECHQKTKKSKRECFDLESETESDEDLNFSVHDSSSDYENLEDILEQERISSPEFSSEFGIGDFLLVEFKAKGKKTASKHYVGEIVEIIPGYSEKYYCKFMRKFLGPKAPKNDFVYPSVDDLSIIDKPMIIMSLDPPQILRGHYTFEIQGCDKFNIQ